MKKNEIIGKCPQKIEIDETMDGRWVVRRSSIVTYPVPSVLNSRAELIEFLLKVTEPGYED